MAYHVTAGRVSVQTQINDKGARAYVDKFRGETLPDDVPREQIETLLRLGKIAEAEPEGEKPLAKRTNAEIQAYAEENGIDLGDATKKDDMLAAIELAAEAAASGDNQS